MIVLGSILILLTLLWACPALYIRGPAQARDLRIAMACGWGGMGLLAVILAWLGRPGIGFAGYGLCFAALLMWWFSLRPSHDRAWADDVARLLSSEQEGSRVTLHNLRNFTWRSPTDYEPRWESRSYDLDRLCTVDAALSYWMGPAIAHTLVSFGFDDGTHVTFSIEIRKKRGEKFNPVGGLFRQFEASLVAADERDILAVRTNARGEDVYLYRVLMPRPEMRSLFLAYLAKAQDLKERPRFYNTLTANCTTMVYEMVRRIIHGLPMDRRLILSGYLPEYLQAVEALMPGHDLATLRREGRITDRARAAGNADDFSARIRMGVPGYDSRGRPVPVEDAAAEPARAMAMR